MLGHFNIGVGSATLAWGWPLRLRPPQGKSCASHLFTKNYCNKRNSPNIFLRQRKSAGALLAYIHDVECDAIKMIAIVNKSVGKSKSKRFL